MQEANKLLPHLKPEAYNIHLTLNEDNTAFSGQCTLDAAIQQTTDTLTLHAKDLSIDSVKVLDHNGTKVGVTDTKTDDASQTLMLTLENEVEESTTVTLNFTYSANVSDSMHGIYPAQYEENGEQKTIISTQFESHHAREAFPCIDEPAAKATFELTLTANTQEFISNTNAVSEEEADGRKTVQFEPTPVMSTYLLAFAIGDFGAIETTTDRGVAVRALAPKEHVEHLDFALETARRCLDFYEDYFGVEYPLNTCDLLAIPEFAAGAMENWGCITFRETTLLVDNNNSSLANKQFVALVIAHELAHQWFGNLVTMEWWDDLWLNEGFASWIEYLAVDALFPQWSMWTNFIADDYSGALQLDALESSHPIRIHVHDPREINEIFDAITYRKGASVIRMLHDYIGHDAFREGLRDYIKTYAYANATTENLWEQLSKHADFDVADFMESWTKDTGYPFVSLSRKDSEWHLNQQRFLLHPEKDLNDTLWQVPLLPLPELAESPTLLSGKNLTLKDEDGELIKINRGQSGLYRVAYPSDHYTFLAEKVTNDELSAEDRMGVLDDAFELAKAGHISTVDALTLLAAFSDETVYPVWENITGELGHLRNSVLTNKYEKRLAPYIEKLIANHYDKLGWTPAAEESDNETLTRPIMLGVALRFELFDASEKARKLMDQFLQNGEPIPADIRSAVYGFNARHGDAELYDQLLERYRNTALQEEKNRFAGALTAFKQPELIKRSLSLMQSDDVRQQDVISWLAGLLRNEFAREQTWQWYQDNWDWLSNAFKDGHIYSYLAQVLGFFVDEEKVKEIQDFFQNKDTTGLERSLEQSIERIEYQAMWRERDLEDILNYLQSS